MDDILLYFSFVHQGDWDKIYESIKQKEAIQTDKLRIFKNQLQCKYLTLLSPDYPSVLKQVRKPPFILFYQGDINLLQSPLIFAVIGTRNPSTYGCEITKELSQEFVNQQVCIISGLAKGIDTAAHQTALLHHGKTIAVLGNGINHIYPPENEHLQDEIAQKGLLLSEYPPNVMSNKVHFPFRNRIIAALANAIIVTEAKLRSGTQITVSYGLDLGKEIYCVPSPNLQNSACNYLIKQGAKLIEDAYDVLEEFDTILVKN